MRRTWIVSLIALAACGGEGDGGPADAAGPDAPPSVHWAAAPAIPGGPIQETAAVAVGTDVWVLGGLTTFTDHTAAVWVYDTIGKTWSAGPDLPQPMHHANAAVVDGSIYVVGFLGQSFNASGAVLRHTPGVDVGWVALTGMPAGTQRGASVTGVIDGKIYVAGGLRGFGAVADVSAYDPGTDTWDDAIPDLAMPRDHACGGVIDGGLYVAGGRQGDIGSQTASFVTLVPGGPWADLPAMPTGRGGTACGVIQAHLVVVGGEGNPDTESGVFPQTEIYDAVAGRWDAGEPMSTPRHGMAAAVVAGVLHVPAGAIHQSIGPVDTHETFTP
jgi:N-acetylneuraminic acid mutarotase